MAKLNWTAIAVWTLVIVALLGAFAYLRPVHVAPAPVPAVEVAPLPLPPIEPLPLPHRIHKRLPHPVKKAALDITPPAYTPRTKKYVRGQIDCNEIPPIARTTPWATVQAAALARGATQNELIELRACLGG